MGWCGFDECKTKIQLLMKVIVKKRYKTEYGTTYEPGPEVLNLFTSPHVLRAIADGKLQIYGQEKRVVDPVKDTPVVKSKKVKTKDIKEDK